MVMEIELTQNKRATVDDVDFDYISSLGKWYVMVNRGLFYAQRQNPSAADKKITMHRTIMESIVGPIPSHYVVDHIDGDTLNNSRGNLRICSDIQNLRNSRLSKANKSGYKGVSWKKHCKKWLAQIQFEKKCYHLGLFADPVEAAKAYNAAAVKYFGEFARLNEVP